LLTRLSRRVALVSLAAAVVFPALVSAQSDGPGNLDPLLQSRARRSSGRSRVIVEFRGTPDATVITRDGGVARRLLPRMRAQVADVNNQSLENLARQPDVARVLADRRAFPTIERSGASIGAAFARWQFGLSGQGVGVAVIDSGVAALHDDINLANPLNPQASPRVLHFRDFTREDSEQVWLSELPTDDFGHGTHVAGIIAGNGFDSYGANSGVAPKAHLVALKVLDANGQGYVSDVIDAIDYAIAIKDTYNIRVINLSVATGVFESYRTDPLAQAAKRAVDAGIVVVAAAGNLGENEEGRRQFGGITCPGNAPWVLTVGAASHEGTTRRSDDTRGDFSSIGPTWIDFAAKPDLLAYGVGIESLAAPHSTLYTQHPDDLLDGFRPTQFKPYMSLSGTSMAAPVVSGTIALMLEANPKLTPNAVKALLHYSAERRPGEHALAQGAGLLNARGAIRMARFFAEPARVGPVPWDTLAGEDVLWGRQILWGNVRVGGGIPLPGSNAWKLGVTWGAGKAPDGEPITWGVNTGDNIVWSTYVDNIVWSTSADDNIVWSTRDHSLEWSTADADNIVWSTAHMENVVWGRDCGGANCRRTLWGKRAADGSAWGTAGMDDNIVWSTNDDNIVWSTYDDNIVWSTGELDGNIVWSTGDDIAASTANDPVANPSDEITSEPDAAAIVVVPLPDSVVQPSREHVPAAGRASAAAAEDTTGGSPPAGETPAGDDSAGDNIVWSTSEPVPPARPGPGSGASAPDGTTPSADDNIVWSTGAPAAPEGPAAGSGASGPPVAVEGVP
ncbi:MAG TPA: S8 family peptidase, partial [Vicinamibacterales bacterium]